MRGRVARTPGPKKGPRSGRLAEEKWDASEGATERRQKGMERWQRGGA